MDIGASSYRRFLDGNDGAIAQIVEEYKDGLILYLNGYVNNIFIAEDLAEDTFFRLITKKPKFSGKSSFKTWLYAIGRNIAVDYIRHNSESANPTPEQSNHMLSAEHDLLESLIKEENKIILHKTIGNLSADYRNVLWLIYFEEFSNKEAATIMHKSEKQIRNLLYRAKISIRKNLTKENYFYEDF